MKNYKVFLGVLLAWGWLGMMPAQLFQEDFGTTFNTTQLGAPNWSSCRSKSSNSSLGPCYSSGDYGAYISNSEYLVTEAITIPSTGYCLTFSYSFNNSSATSPIVEVGTGGAFCFSGTMTWNTLGTLAATPTCDLVTYSLDAYAGQTIWIRFAASTSFTALYLDDIVVDNSGCGGGSGGGCSNIVFSDGFADGSIGAPEWTSVSNAFTSTGTPCNGGDSRVWFSTFSSPAEAVTQNIDLTGATTAEVSLDYYMAAAAFSFQCAYIEISTNGGVSWNDVTPTYADPDGSCQHASSDISAYVGFNVQMRIRRASTSQTFYFDNFEVCTDGGGSGVNYKWADNFNDNDLTLDYTGVDGDEDCPSCGPWVLGSGASLDLVPAAGWNGSSNNTEAFVANMSNVYYVRLDRNEYIESPVLDMSQATGFKISFHAKSSSPGSGGGDQWSFSDRLRLQIWDGAAWITVQSMRDDLSATWNGPDDYISSGLPLNYYCFTAYRDAASPGNYYYNTTPNVNSAYFHSGFKFRVIFEGGFSGSPFAWVDDFTFRADNDGYSTMIPCGLSFWNEPAATSYGQDPGTTGNTNAEKGVELELDNSINIPPNWITEADDGDTVTQVFGPGESERLVFCVLSEHEIDFAYPLVHWYAPDIGNQSSVMSKDNNYTGPGWKYYAVEYTSCDLAGGSIALPTDQFRYHFSFDYGLSGFIPVYYQLNSSGIEFGGGVTSIAEQFTAPDVISGDGCGVLPMNDLALRGNWAGENVELNWASLPLEGVESLNLWRKMDEGDWAFLANPELGEYEYADENVGAEITEKVSYRLGVRYANGEEGWSETVILGLEGGVSELRVWPNPGQGNWNLSLPSGAQGTWKLMDIQGRAIADGALLAGQPLQEIQVNNLESGIYFLLIPTENGILKEKLVVLP